MSDLDMQKKFEGMFDRRKPAMKPSVIFYALIWGVGLWICIIALYYGLTSL